MNEIKNDGHNIPPAIREQGESLNKTTFQIHKTIDWNSNVFKADSGDHALTYAGPELGNRLYMIEKFVEEVKKGGKAFSTKPTSRGLMRPLALAKYLGMMSAFLTLHSPTKIYSPHVELFFDTLVTKYGLEPDDFNGNPDAHSPLFKMKQGEFLNRLIEDISKMTSQRAFKRKLYARTEAINRGHSSAKKYLNALHERYARLLVLRIDFGFRTSDPVLPHPVGLLEAQDYLARFFNNKRGKSLYSNLKGYIWRLEYGKQKGYHFHLFFLFDGSKAHKDEFLANEIGADWTKVTDGKGIYHNCNAHKQSYKRLGIGMIAHDDEEKRRNLLEVLEYMYKEDQTLREKHADKTHGWGRGAMPMPPQLGLGRPRKKPEC